MSKKNNIQVKFPLSFTLQDKSKYTLYGMIEHKGWTSGGHYVAFVKRKGGWFKYNDESVVRISSEMLQQRQAYILFYERELQSGTKKGNIKEKELNGNVRQPSPVATPIQKKERANLVEKFTKSPKADGNIITNLPRISPKKNVEHSPGKNISDLAKVAVNEHIKEILQRKVIPQTSTAKKVFSSPVKVPSPVSKQKPKMLERKAIPIKNVESGSNQPSKQRNQFASDKEAEPKLGKRQKQQKQDIPNSKIDKKPSQSLNEETKDQSSLAPKVACKNYTKRQSRRVKEKMFPELKETTGLKKELHKQTLKENKFISQLNKHEQEELAKDDPSSERNDSLLDSSFSLTTPESDHLKRIMDSINNRIQHWKNRKHLKRTRSKQTRSNNTKIDSRPSKRRKH